MRGSRQVQRLSSSVNTHNVTTVPNTLGPLGDKLQVAENRKVAFSDEFAKHGEAAPGTDAELKNDWKVGLPLLTHSVQVFRHHTSLADKRIVCTEASVFAAACFEIAHVGWVWYWHMVVVEQGFVLRASLCLSHRNINEARLNAFVKMVQATTCTEDIVLHHLLD